jgi:hypothetical protein
MSGGSGMGKLSCRETVSGCQEGELDCQEEGARCREGELGYREGGAGLPDVENTRKKRLTEWRLANNTDRKAFISTRFDIKH